MRIPESELIINSDGTIFHLHMSPDQLAPTVVLVGDPGRVELFKNEFEEIQSETSSREFRSITGLFKGHRITALSTGIGTDNIDIVLTELDALANIDFKTREVKKEHTRLQILRIGTTGSLQPDVPLGAYIFSEISMGADGLLNWYADRDKYSELDIQEAFKEHVHWDKNLPNPYFVKCSPKILEKFKSWTVPGITISASGFYGPQGRSVRIPLAMPNMVEDIISFRFGKYKVTNFEMESSAVAGLSAHLGHDAGTVCLAVAQRANKASNPDYKSLMNDLIHKSLEALISE